MTSPIEKIDPLTLATGATAVGVMGLNPWRHSPTLPGGEPNPKFRPSKPHWTQQESPAEGEEEEIDIAATQPPEQPQGGPNPWASQPPDPMEKSLMSPIDHAWAVLKALQPLPEGHQASPLAPAAPAAPAKPGMMQRLKSNLGTVKDLWSNREQSGLSQIREKQQQKQEEQMQQAQQAQAQAQEQAQVKYQPEQVPLPGQAPKPWHNQAANAAENMPEMSDPEKDKKPIFDQSGGA